MHETSMCQRRLCVQDFYTLQHTATKKKKRANAPQHTTTSIRETSMRQKKVFGEPVFFDLCKTEDVFDKIIDVSFCGKRRLFLRKESVRPPGGD